MAQKNQSVKVEIEEGDATVFPAEVLVLKYAQGLFGADLEVVDKLENEGLLLRAQLPSEGEVLLVESLGHIEAEKILFVGVEKLYEFGYRGIRDFARRALEALSEDAPETQYVSLTVHGVNCGLDEFEAFEAEIAGLVDAITEYKFPLDLECVTFVERDAARADRLRDILQELLPNGCIESRRETFAEGIGEDRAARLRSAGYSTENKPHIFVAMPFAPEMQDTYDYGIVGAARAAGLVCERADLSAFTGDVLAWVKKRIKTASLVVADLTTANPNVYLEVGYAWGSGVPTVLLARDIKELKFDVRTQRCIVYQRIKELEESLVKELEALRKGLGI